MAAFATASDPPSAEQTLFFSSTDSGSYNSNRLPDSARDLSPGFLVANSAHPSSSALSSALCLPDHSMVDSFSYPCTCGLRQPPYSLQSSPSPASGLNALRAPQALGNSDLSVPQPCNGEASSFGAFNTVSATVPAMPTQSGQQLVSDASIPLFSCEPSHVPALASAAPQSGAVHLCPGANMPTSSDVVCTPNDTAFPTFQPAATCCGSQFPFQYSFPSPSHISSFTKESSHVSSSRSLTLRQDFLAPAYSQHRSIRAASNKRSRASPQEGPSASDELNIKRVRAADGTSKDVVAISRVPYVRPQQPRKFCPHCNEHPDGFRGEHEVRRHIDRAHAREGRRKMWICVEKDPESNMLSNCKKCRSGKKYGAYYNAAAHLRRTHFNPRQKGDRGTLSGSNSRDSAGVAEDPPMHELKQFWIKEVDDSVSTTSSDGSPVQVARFLPALTDTGASPIFHRGEFNDGCLSLRTLSPLDIESENLAPSRASLSSSEDTGLDNLWSPFDAQPTFDYFDLGVSGFPIPLSVQ